MSFALNRKGKPGKGEVTLSATLTNQTQLQQTAISAGALTSGAQLLRVVCHQATGLKSGDMFSKNDVYVQSYFVPIDTDASKALPVPEKNMQLPVGEYVIPFEFKIPNGTLPSSCEASGFDWDVNEAYVRCLRVASSPCSAPSPLQSRCYNHACGRLKNQKPLLAAVAALL